MHPADSADSIAQLHRYIAEQKPLLTKRYVILLAYNLSQQLWDGCFGRNVLAVI
ncbi:hypothetical protein [Methylosoma difficile]